MNTLVQQQFRKHKGKIIWLASYPKSGNTWFRAFLTALIKDGEININHLIADGSITSRTLFDESTFLESSLLTKLETQYYFPELVNFYAKYKKNDRVLFAKTHLNFLDGPNSFITKENTLGIIYFLRNPLAVTPSLANHFNCTIDKAIQFMNMENANLANQERSGINNFHQFEQPLGTWNSHVESWLSPKSVPVYLLQYEKMKENMPQIVREVFAKMDIQIPFELIERAVINTEFSKLKEQEEDSEKGFSEKPLKAATFFRKGQIDLWKSELSKNQQSETINNHEEVMRKYGYL